MRKYVLPFLLWLIYSSLRWTWRVEVHETKELKEDLSNNSPVLFAHWHGDELGILFLLRRYKCAAMISTSKDGDIMAGVVQWLGAAVSRGSSTRGGAQALRGILRLSRAGFRPSIAVDGPKGPYHKVKPGVFEISRVLNARIHPLTVASSKSYVFHKAWNKTFLPLPFSRVFVIWGAPLPAVQKSDDARSEGLALALEKTLSDAGREAAQKVATADS